MGKFRGFGNIKLYIYVAALLLLLGLWRAGEAVSEQLLSLPVKAAPKTGGGAPALDEKSFYPVWVKQAGAREPVSQDQPVDSVFKLPIAPAQAASALTPVVTEPDYGLLFRQSVQIDGVADDGLFINGKFYAVGAKLTALAMTSPAGKLIVPTLVSLMDGRVVFEVNGQKISTSRTTDSN